MPSLDSSFALLSPVQESILDKDTGLPLVGGIVTFYSDINRTILKDVYELSESASPTYTYNSVGSQLVLGQAGQFLDLSGANFIPYLWLFDGTPSTTTGEPELYYITVYAAAPPVGSGLLQFTVSAWPGLSNSGASENASQVANVNMITNPQFVESFLTTGYSTTISVTGSNTATTIAPDWNLVTTGTGTVTISNIANTFTQVPSNPPYIMSFSNWSGGITQASLQQTLTNSPNILASVSGLGIKSFVSGSMVVAIQDAGSHPFTMSFISPASVSTQIFTETAGPSAAYDIYSGVIQLPDAAASSAGSSILSITLPTGASFYITSIQLVSVAENSPSPAFLQQTTALQKSGLFHYYENPLLFKPIPSYLVGWDFPLNPAQFGTNIGPITAGIPNNSFYAWDQTIVFQSVDNSVTVSRTANLGELHLATSANTQVAIVQYLTGAQVQNILRNAATADLTTGLGLSTFYRGETTVATTITISLWWTANASFPALSSNISLVSGLDSNGHPSSVVAGWNEIIRPNFGNATFTTQALGTNDFGFNGYIDENAYSTGTKFAIVVGTGPLTSGHNISFTQVSLVPGSVPTLPAPQTADEVLRECQYYYEQSYDGGGASNPAGTAGNAGAMVAQQSALTISTATNTYATSFGFKFSTVKVATPPAANVFIYSIAGTLANVSAYVYSNTAVGGPTDAALTTYWAANPSALSKKSLIYETKLGNLLIATTTNGATSPARGSIEYHYIIDTRLGTF